MKKNKNKAKYIENMPYFRIIVNNLVYPVNMTLNWFTSGDEKSYMEKYLHILKVL